MHPTHQKGLLGELEFTIYFIEKGYTVLQPINPNSSYDLVIEKDGKFSRIQIKYLQPYKGRLRVELERPKRKTLGYKERDVDAIGVFDGLNHKYYFIPIEKVMTKSEFWLRLESPKNSQKKHVHLAKEFEI